MNIAEELKSNGSIQTDVEIFGKLLKFGKEEGYISQNATMPMIIELVSQSEKICRSVFNALDDSLKKESANIFDSLDIFFGWCVYMGLGITYLFKNNLDNLSVDDMCKKIINERTIYAMDEYVSDLVGMKYASDESEKFAEHSRLAGQLCMLTLPVSDNEKIMQQIRYTAKALFDYGCAIEMNRLGM